MIELDTDPCARCGKETPSNLLKTNPDNGLLYCPGCLSMGIEEKTPSGRVLPATRTGRELKAMDIVIEWLLYGLIPRLSVILMYGRGGIGKTTLIMLIANAIERGIQIFGIDTVKVPVIIVDFENSLAVLSDCAKRTNVDGVMFIDSSSNPPHLDKPEWTVYLDLLAEYPGALFVFDTLRSSHSGDENDSKTMALIMSRMRQLRDAGATIILLHHTPKGNDRQFKGSGAIFDLCDQTLALYQTAKPGSEQEAEEDDDATDKVYRFGTGKKTRYKPHRIFLTFDTDQEVFTLAKDPDDEPLEVLHGIITDLSIIGCAKQTEIVKKAADYDIGGDKKILAFLRKGVGRFWTTEKGLHNSTIYRPIQFGSLAPPLRGEKLKNWNNQEKTDSYKVGPIGAVAKLNNTPDQSGNATSKLPSCYNPPTVENAEFASMASPSAKQAKQEESVFDFLDEVA